MTNKYRAFGLVFASDLPLPELPECEADLPPDATIRLGPIVKPDTTGDFQLGPTAWARPERLVLEVAGIATFLVEHGSQILVDPRADIDDDSIRLFLLGSVMGALLLQRGHLVLHGNAIVIDGCALVCVGESGAGKSTLAHAFQSLGHQVLADDVVAINQAQHALPGIPRVKLWRDVIDRLNLPIEDMARVRPVLEKYAIGLGNSGAAQGTHPVRWICVLKPAHVAGVDIEEVDGRAAFNLLFDNLYRPLLAQQTLTPPVLMSGLGSLANNARLAIVRRPIAGFALDELVSALRRHVGEAS